MTTDSHGNRPPGARSADASEVPDLDQLADMVDTADIEQATPDPAQAPPPTEEASDEVPTDYYHAVKPKPKAVPLSEVGEEDAVPEESQEPLEGSWLRRSWGWIVAVLVLGAAVAAAAVLRPGEEAPLTPTAGETQIGPVVSTTRRGQPNSHLAPHEDWRAAPASDRLVDPATDDRPLRTNAREPVRVPFERRGNAILVPARLRGPAGEVVAKMVFDTGATYSTIDNATLQPLGIAIGDATSEVETAAGVIRRPITVVQSVSVGTAEVDGGLTFGVCDTCAASGAAGLLGLNFSRHFVVTIDHEAGRLQLEPKAGALDQIFDIRPFIKLMEPTTERRGKALAIRFILRNDSPRAIHDVTVVAQSESLPTPPQTRIARVDPGARQEAHIDSEAAPANSTFTLSITEARW